MMYTLFLCLRYLTRKKIVVFPILAVWLCVMMLIIVNSIMTGFVNRVRSAGRGLMGDVVIQSRSAAGFPYYAQIQTRINRLPQVAASTPVVNAYGLFNLPNFQTSMGVEIVGIDPATQSQVSHFGSDLFWQHAAPLQTAADLAQAQFPASRHSLLTYAQARLKKAINLEEKLRKKLVAMPVITPTTWFAAIRHHWQAIAREDWENANYAVDRSFRDLGYLRRLPAHSTFASDAALRRALVPAVVTFKPPAQARQHYASPTDEPANGCIIGVDLGLYQKDRFGHYHRPADVRFSPAILTVVPVTLRSTLAMPQSRRFQIVDDCRTRVFTADSSQVYAPFKVVQKMAFMQQQDLLGGGTRPARCSQIQIRVHGDSSHAAVVAARRAIAAVVRKFVRKHPRLQDAGLQVQTWDQVQAQYIRAVDNERDLITFLLGLMSMVVVVVIFLIFFMIVRDKTRDIGIIKAIGGSEIGVGTIFLLYGLLISAAGALPGMLAGVEFVRHDNYIHDHILWRYFGISIWNRKIYIFSHIPDQVDMHAVATIVALAILAGLVGAFIPALIASMQDPVEALRYE